MVDSFSVIDQKILLAINGMAGNGLLDEFMLLISSKLIWLPLYGFILYSIIKKYGVHGAVWMVLGSIALVVLTDQSSVLLFKEVFMRPRPCHDDNLINLLSLQDGRCGGTFGFVSSHAANVAGIATFWLLSFFRTSRLWYLLVLWPSTVCVSRVFLGVHYPSDVFVGALFGASLGFLMYKLVNRIV